MIRQSASPMKPKPMRPMRFMIIARTQLNQSA
jgi:hypothetical protein